MFCFQLSSIIVHTVLVYYITARSPGLANRLVPQGQSLKEAKLLARQILSHPQNCLRGDFTSARHSVFSGHSLGERLRREYERGREVVERESVRGARQFAAGKGRGGIFDFDNGD